MPARRCALHLAALLALGAAAWLAALGGRFQYDDWPNIVLDPASAEWPALATRLVHGLRPLLRLSYFADHALWGFEPAGFLATNLALHLGTVAGVWALARRRLGLPAAAWLAAALFALQPAHGAVIASASGRSTGLSTLLLVLALLAHERAVAGGAPPRQARRWQAAALLCFALAVAAKEVALVFPALLLLWEGTRTPPLPTTRQALRRAAPAALAALALALLAFAYSTRLREITAFSLALAGPLEALALHAAALPASLLLWLQPWALAVEHPAPPAAAAWPGALGLLALAAAALALRRRAPLATLALLWPLVMLLPTHSVLARLDPVVEKALYPAWIGPCLGLGALLAAAARQAAGARMAVGLLVLALAGASGWRAARWSEPAALWAEATERAPLSARAWHNRALAEADAGRHDAATRSLARALALNPDSPRSEQLALALALQAEPPASLPALSPEPRP